MSSTRNKIISYLSQNPYVTRGQLAAELSLREQAVRKQIHRLIKEGRIKQRFEVADPGASMRKSFIFINTRFPGHDKPEQEGDAPATGYQHALCERIAKELLNNDVFAEHMSLSEIRVLIGADWDIVLSVHCDNPDIVNDFVTDYLRVQPDVDRTLTSSAHSRQVLRS